MNNQTRNWEVLNKVKTKNIADALLKNRGIKTEKEKREFFNPIPPQKLTLKQLGISKLEVGKAIKRIKKALKSKEKVIIYGDYDADGICGTAILWEALYSLGLDVLPYIPERFSEGYGLNAKSVENLKLKIENLRLIITVDNGIVAKGGLEKANKLGIDVIITDHHQKGKLVPNAYCLIHTTKISGSAVAWVLSREIKKNQGLDLVAIGTIADQLPLVGVNRSFAKYGLEELNKTKRSGLLALFEEAGIEAGSIGPYEIGFIIAPRINAMGRLVQAVDSLRLLCTKNKKKAEELAKHIGHVNRERQKIVEKVVLHAREKLGGEIKDSVIVLAHEEYHEGVIGLAAAKLVEEFYRPVIVFSKKKDISKASARSISGFNIIEAIRKLENLYIEGGGHPIAAGFSIETLKIEEFTRKINEVAQPLLTDDILSRKLKIDLELNFDQLNWQLYNTLESFEPTGLGNPTPTFVSRNVEVAGARVVGRDAKHLKLRLRLNSIVFDAIAFGFGSLLSSFTPDKPIDIVYTFEDNFWNGSKSLQLKIKDIKLPR